MPRLVRLGLFLLSAVIAVGAADTRAPKAPVPAAAPAPAAAPRLEEGEIAGAKFTIARPARWNRRLLLLAHGLRAETAPLVADLSPGHLAYQTLLAEGWIVAKTSYRRNGMIIADAIADLDALRAYIVRIDGSPERVLLEGESMGGLIATIIAERGPDLNEQGRPDYDGAVAIGAALSLREPNASIGLSLQPKLPLVFLTNQSEFDGPKKYVETFALRDKADVRPLLLRIARDGHVNVNQRERLVALRILDAWIDSGQPLAAPPARGEAFVDVTVPPAPQPSQVTPDADGRGFAARVVEISAGYGNLLLNAQPGDFAAAGIRPMTWFQLKVGGKIYRVRYGRDFDSVKRGEWVAFPNADGLTWLVRNYADAATTAGLNPGDAVTLRRYDEPLSESAP